MVYKSQAIKEMKVKEYHWLKILVILARGGKKTKILK
jgi:hypothetical protein